MAFEILEGPDGQPIAAKANEAGAQRVEVTGSALPAGAATAAKQDEQLARTPELDTPEDGDPGVPGVPVTARLQGFVVGNGWYNVPLYGNALLGSELALPVRIASAPTLLTQPAPGFAASSPHAGGDTPQGATFYLAGVDRENVGGEVDRWALSTKAYQGDDWTVTAIGDIGKPLFAYGIDAITDPENPAPERLATHLNQETTIVRIELLTDELKKRIMRSDALSAGWSDVASALLFTGATRFWKARVGRSGAPNTWVQFHDTTTLPSASAVAKFWMPAPAMGYWTEEEAVDFVNGIYFVTSSTPRIYTADVFTSSGSIRYGGV